PTYRAREMVTLNGVLIASVKRFSAQIFAEEVATVIDKNLARPIIGSIKRYLDLYASLSPQKMHPLIRHQLRATGKYGMAGGKFQNGRCQVINLHIFISSD